MEIKLDLNRLEDYRLFLKIKSLPRYAFRGRVAWFPDEYGKHLGLNTSNGKTVDYIPHPDLFDYQRDIARLAIKKRRFCIFADCGLGKTLIFLEFARHAVSCLGKNGSILIVSPLMVIPQTIAECQKFYGDSLTLEKIPAAKLQDWLNKGNGIGITNYEAITDGLNPARLGGLILDESSLLKSHYGKWGTRLIEMGKGLEWKLCSTGTPAPNDRIEFANHAVFMDAFPTVNSFLAKYFVNRGQTGERWELKPHALDAFYRSLSHWCIFLTNPATYGWKDNTENIPPVHVHIHEVETTDEQQALVFSKTRDLFASEIGGITSRSVLSQIAKGNYQGKRVATSKPAFIRALVNSWPEESTLIWCLYNREQEILEHEFPEAVSITGQTPLEERQRAIDAFKSGKTKILISKPKILGFGLNLQIATRQVFSGLQDSYEQFYQAVKRSNRYGSHLPLNVHIPVTEIERPMIETVLAKAGRVQKDTEEQERIFKNASKEFLGK